MVVIGLYGSKMTAYTCCFLRDNFLCKLVSNMDNRNTKFTLSYTSYRFCMYIYGIGEDLPIKGICLEKVSTKVNDISYCIYLYSFCLFC